MERYAIAPCRSRLNRQIENGSTERLCSRLNRKQNWCAIVSFPSEQPICPFQNWSKDGISTVVTQFFNFENDIFQDLESFGNERIFKMSMEKFWIFVWKNAENISKWM